VRVNSGGDPSAGQLVGLADVVGVGAGSKPVQKNIQHE